MTLPWWVGVVGLAGVGVVLWTRTKPAPVAPTPSGDDAFAGNATAYNGSGWVWKQSSGELYYGSAKVAVGYSGLGDGLNNPNKQNVPNVGPIPTGGYVIGPAFDSPSSGPLTLPLQPTDPAFAEGRTGFEIHGDSLEHPGQASHGCIVVARAAREQIVESGDPNLQVIV